VIPEISAFFVTPMTSESDAARLSRSGERLAAPRTLADMPSTLGPLPRDARVYVAGHRGLVGSAVWRHLESQGFTHLVGRTSSDLDLRDREATFAFFADERPDYVVLAAAKVGGILANATYPNDFLSDNLRIQLNVLDAAHEHGVTRLLFLGSSCIYPKHAPQPIREDSLLTGPLEPTNDAYAIAKIAGVLQVQALRRQHGVSFISAMPTNLYGPGDNFDLQTSHVLPAMIRRFHEAKQSGAPSVTLWGSGTPRREFLHVDDLAAACLHLLEHYDDPAPINVGTGVDLTVRELAEKVAAVTGYTGRIEWDTSKPDGTPRKLLDVSRLQSLGWAPTITLDDGIRATYAWYTSQLSRASRR
jgi:GDP-L-fucose synthase